MLKWLKKRLRDWILEDDSPPSLQLEVMQDGRIERGLVTQAMGLHLMCQFKNGSQKLIKESEALNTSHFRKIWKHMSKVILTWEDGDQFEF